MATCPLNSPWNFGTMPDLLGYCHIYRHIYRHISNLSAISMQSLCNLCFAAQNGVQRSSVPYRDEKQWEGCGGDVNASIGYSFAFLLRIRVFSYAINYVICYVSYCSARTVSLRRSCRYPLCLDVSSGLSGRLVLRVVVLGEPLAVVQLCVALLRVLLFVMFCVMFCVMFSLSSCSSSLALTLDRTRCLVSRLSSYTFTGDLTLVTLMLVWCVWEETGTTLQESTALPLYTKLEQFLFLYLSLLGFRVFGSPLTR